MKDKSVSSVGLRVLVVEDDTLVGVGIGKMLVKLGHKVAGQASTADEARHTYSSATMPQLVLMDIKLDGTDGIDLAVELMAVRPCPVIIISAYSDPELIRRAGAAGVFGYLIKPVTPESLEAQIEVVVRRFGEQQELLRQKKELEEMLESRKLVERAKGIFMKRLKIDEEEAHRRVQFEAQKRRIKMIEMARKIIDMEEMLVDQDSGIAKGYEEKSVRPPHVEPPKPQ